MKPAKHLLILFFSTFVLSVGFAQQQHEYSEEKRIVFYNVENYFDAFEDSTINYNEFTPDGNRHWTYSRFKRKRIQLYKVFTALGGWNLPSIIGFAEIENRFVLVDLIKNTPLKDANYQVVHYESNDHRGIDVGVIYRKDDAVLLYSRAIRLFRPDSTDYTTRDILYVKFLIETDTLHLLYNHWPSRYGGLLETSPVRKYAASVVMSITDSICESNTNASILIMGDFNDDPDDESIQSLTHAESICRLQNLDLQSANNQVKGTLKYQSDWNEFDQILASGSMLEEGRGLKVSEGIGHIFGASFLLEADEKHLGMRPKRTYIGYTYNGGFSDHLPVFVDIYATIIK